jgi:ferredoxin
VLLPLEEGVCPLGEVARVARHLAAESAGQCGPCRLGLPAIGDAFSAFAAGRAGHDALAKVKEGGAIVRGRGACHHPDGTTRFLLSALEVFEEDVAAHLARGTCGRPVRDVLPLPGDDLVEQASGVRLSVDWSRCAGHGLCGRLAPELITLDMFGYPLIDEGPIATRLLRAASQTAEMCPSLALGLKRA